MWFEIGLSLCAHYRASRYRRALHEIASPIALSRVMKHICNDDIYIYVYGRATIYIYIYIHTIYITTYICIYICFFVALCSCHKH